MRYLFEEICSPVVNTENYFEMLHSGTRSKSYTSFNPGNYLSRGMFQTANMQHDTIGMQCTLGNSFKHRKHFSKKKTGRVWYMFQFIFLSRVDEEISIRLKPHSLPEQSISCHALPRVEPYPITPPPPLRGPMEISQGMFFKYSFVFKINCLCHISWDVRGSRYSSVLDSNYDFG